jgi:hypothetical protein
MAASGCFEGFRSQVVDVAIPTTHSLSEVGRFT